MKDGSIFLLSSFIYAIQWIQGARSVHNVFD